MIGGSLASQNGRPAISGWTAAAFIAFVGTIAGLATWATSDANADRIIGEQAGVVVALGLAATFFIAAVAPAVKRTWPNTGATLERIGNFFGPLGVVLSVIDGVMSIIVAPLAGATLNHPLKRYAALLLHLGGATAAAWALDRYAGQPWPFMPEHTIAKWAGFVAIAWGFVIAFSVSRRWAWIEQDRETAMMTGVYEPGPNSSLRIGFDQDLRDEALLSFMFIFLFMPLALSQLDHFGVFKYPETLTPTYLDWLGFFGAELAKAVPFVDWAEVYNVGSGTRIEAREGAGQHVIFASRVLIDLILLAALLQAMQISSRITTQRREFAEKRLSRLDPFAERGEFARLAAGDAFSTEPSDDLRGFAHYDQGRLVHIARHGSTATLRAIALRLLREQRALGLFDLLDERLSGNGHHLGDKSEHVQRLAARLIAESSDPRSGAALLRAITTRNYVHGAHVFCVELVAFVGGLPVPMRVPALMEVLANAGHKEVRLAALKSLVENPPAELKNEIVDAVARRLDPPDQARDVRRAAATALRILGRRRAVAALAKALNGDEQRPRDTDNSVRRRAVEALGMLGGRDALSALQEASNNEPNQSVKDAARVAASRLEGGQAGTDQPEGET